MAINNMPLQAAEIKYLNILELNDEWTKELAIDHYYKTDDYGYGLIYERYEFSEEELIEFSNAIVMNCVDVLFDASKQIKEQFGIK